MLNEYLDKFADRCLEELKLETLIDENSYIDYENAYNNLINLQIEYVDRPDNIDKTILAIYSCIEKKKLCTFAKKNNK